MSTKRRDTFSGARVTYLGGIENEIQGESITGSCTLFRAQDTQGKKVDVVIDFGAHQSGSKSQELNHYIDSRIINADYIIITHAHIDHIGRLPMLIQAGFKGKIFMTNYTKALGEHSLIDSARLMQREFDEIERRNQQKRKKYNDGLRYLGAQERIKANNFRKKGEKDRLKKILTCIEEKYGDVLQEILHNIREYDISSNERIAEIMKHASAPLFNEGQVVKLFSSDQIQILEPGSFTHLKLSSHKGAKDVQNKAQMEEIVLRFLDSAHIVGSVQAEISIKTQRILSESERIREGSGHIDSQEKRYLFSGDLGRTDKGNFAGNLEMPNGEYEYAQVESTYAGRNHPERELSIQDFFQAVLDAKGKVIIPAFSIQRTQDIALLLLRYYEEVVLPEREKLKKRIKQLKKDFEESIKTQEETEIYNQVLSGYKQEFSKLDFEVFCDSALGEKATNIFANMYGKEYSALREDEQKRKYGKVLIHFSEPYIVQTISGDNGSIQINDQKIDAKGKKIFISSGGMCEGGPIIPHLRKHVSNANSTVIFMGYTPPTSLGGKLKTDEVVLIEGKPYKVYADIHDIGGFSGHAGEETLLEYTSRFKNGTTIALTHGGDARWKMKEKMKKPRRGSIEIPQNGDKITLPF